MRKIDLFTINHNRPAISPSGGLVHSFIVDQDDCGGDNIRNRKYYYADWQCHYHVWKNRPDLDIVGFQGRRKLFDFRSGANPGWSTVDLPTFMGYQEWLKTWTGEPVPALLEDHAFITVEPWDVSYNTDMTEDFRHSASPKDWDALMKIMEPLGTFNFRQKKIYSHSMFITTRQKFHDFMTFWWHVIQELEPKLTVTDAGPGAYHVRPMAYLSERILSMWMEKQMVAILPLMICWDAP